ncbi:MAG: hypothetical protein ABR512_09415 [Desulfopila sp.]
MKTPFFLTVAGWILLGFCQAYAEPFAPLVELPDDISSSNISFLEAQTVKKSVIPSQEDVGIPAYPDARVLFTQTGNKATVDGREKSLPNRVFLGTAAPLNTVVEFYTDHLGDEWISKTEDTTVVFWKKSATTTPAEDPTLQKILLKPDDPTRNLMPKAQSTIDIHYYPPQQDQPE